MLNESFAIVQAKRKDIAAIMKVEQNAFAAEVVEKSDSFLERIEIFPQGFLLLKEKHTVAGYFCSELWNKNLKVPYPAELFTLGHSARQTHTQDGTLLYISSLGILSAYRGKGLGNYLFNASIEYIITQLPQIRQIILLVNETWLPARAIYAKAGFEEVQVLSGFFESGTKTEKTRHNGIIMEKRLKG